MSRLSDIGTIFRASDDRKFGLIAEFLLFGDPDTIENRLSATYAVED